MNAIPASATAGQGPSPKRRTHDENFSQYLRRTPLAAMALGIAVMLAGWGLTTSWSDGRQYVGIDLRSRVLGARAFLAGFSMYESRLETGADGRPLDPPVARR